MVMDNNKPKTTPRDFFLNLLSIVTLYFSAISLSILLVQYVNIFVPDVLDKIGYGGDPYSAMRFPVASLFVVFPVYVWTARFLEREHAKTPEKKSIAIHKWLIHFCVQIRSRFCCRGCGSIKLLCYRVAFGTKRQEARYEAR